MSNIMIPFNNQPANTTVLHGNNTTSGSTYTVPAGKYARICITASFGGKAMVNYASDPGASEQTIIWTRPDTNEQNAGEKPSHKIELFNASNNSSASSSGYGDVILPLPGDESDILTAYFRIRLNSGNSPQLISYFSLYKSSNPAIGGVELLPAHFDLTARGQNSQGQLADNIFFNGTSGSAAPVKLPGGSQVKLRFQAAYGLTTDMKVDAWGTIEKKREFNSTTQEIWLVEGDVLHLSQSDWDGSLAFAHIEEYNVQS